MASLPDIQSLLPSQHSSSEVHIRKVISQCFIGSRGITQKAVNGLLGTLCQASCKTGVVDTILEIYRKNDLLKWDNDEPPQYSCTPLGVRYFQAERKKGKEESWASDASQVKRQEELASMSKTSFEMRRENWRVIFDFDEAYFVSVFSGSGKDGVLVRF